MEFIHHVTQAEARQAAARDAGQIGGHWGALPGTGSMEPKFRGGDFLVWEDFRSIRVGDVVTVPGHFTHRVTALGKFRVQTRGDHNFRADEPIFLNQVQGVVRRVHTWPR